MAHRPVSDTDYHEFPPAATPGNTSPHPFRRRRSAGQSAPQQVLYFRPDPQGQGSLRPTLRPYPDGSLKSKPRRLRRRPPVAFPDLPGWRPAGRAGGRDPGPCRSWPGSHSIVLASVPAIIFPASKEQADSNNIPGTLAPLLSFTPTAQPSLPTSSPRVIDLFGNCLAECAVGIVI